MKVGFTTIVLNGMPFIAHHFRTFEKLPFDWVWSISDGPAGNTGDTAWCQKQAQGRSDDGTLDYFGQFADSRIKIVSQDWWDNKTEMVNSALRQCGPVDVCIQIDADEFHTAENLTAIVELFKIDPALIEVRIPCRFFVGPDLVCVGDNCWSNRGTEWSRAWRVNKNSYFFKHEPPTMGPMRAHRGRIIGREESRQKGLIFDHYAYATLKQVIYKEEFYKYRGLVEQWKALQAHTGFPVQLRKFFPFVDAKVLVKRLDPSDIPALLTACLHS